MKIKKMPIVISVILSLISILMFVSITISYLNPDNYDLKLVTYFEKEAYALCGVCYILTFHGFIHNTSSKAKKIFLSFLCGAVFAIQICLLNNLWHYIDFNEKFNWIEPAKYSSFLIDDLKYMHGGMVFRYPLAFALMFFVCLGDSLFAAKIKRKSEQFFNI